EKNQDKRYVPTALGTGVNDFLVTNFGEILDYKFTAGMEDSLDEIANGKKKWQPVIASFWKPFSIKLSLVQDTSERVKLDAEETGEKCPTCKTGDVVIRIGKFGKFLACSTFPTCEYKANYQEKTGQKCEKCGGDVILRKTRSGRTFYGCSNYPKCDFASWNRPSPPAAPFAKVATAAESVRASKPK
ncbi:MAG: topoisomerase DNA-binding C4 zinc finger domain-containing protein, partial [Candidatus Amesbacteria bacterium]|nr:topoisomerase DNA-binding C4 zinc finger domain-containing protein [Candidatus Amesbacteria bacterium]